MAKKILSDVKVAIALKPASYNAGAATGAAVDGTGYGRCCFVFHAGSHGTGGTQTVKITSCATSGGSYADVESAAHAAIADDADETIYLIDIPVDPAKPFMKLVDTVATAACLAGAEAILYNGTRTLPPAQLKTAVVL